MSVRLDEKGEIMNHIKIFAIILSLAGAMQLNAAFGFKGVAIGAPAAVARHENEIRNQDKQQTFYDISNSKANNPLRDVNPEFQAFIIKLQNPDPDEPEEQN